MKHAKDVCRIWMNVLFLHTFSVSFRHSCIFSGCSQVSTSAAQGVLKEWRRERGRKTDLSFQAFWRSLDKFLLGLLYSLPKTRPCLFVNSGLRSEFSLPPLQETLINAQNLADLAKSFLSSSSFFSFLPTVSYCLPCFLSFLCLLCFLLPVDTLWLHSSSILLLFSAIWSISLVLPIREGFFSMVLKLLTTFCSFATASWNCLPFVMLFARSKYGAIQKYKKPSVQKLQEGTDKNNAVF